jgi:hypothetical protein
MSYLAPYPLDKPARTIPDGEFLLPMCARPERFVRFFAALVQGGWTMYGEEVGDHSIDVLRALAYINDPSGGLCNFEVDGDEPCDCVEPPTGGCNCPLAPCHSR